MDKLYVIEELDGFMEEQIRAAGIDCVGKELTGKLYELNPQLLRERIFGQKPETPIFVPFSSIRFSGEVQPYASRAASASSTLGWFIMALAGEEISPSPTSTPRTPSRRTRPSSSWD